MPTDSAEIDDWRAAYQDEKAKVLDLLTERNNLQAKVARVEALVAAEIAEVTESRVRAARGDVRCLDCNLRYDERQEYRCHVVGGGHDYDEGDLIAAEEIERSGPVEHVTLSVAGLLAALAEGGES